jgi:pimeloyl-ACP methyl ester carboxylesterase
VDDIEIRYAMSGEGPAVVLLHGLAEDHGSWQPVLDGIVDRTLYAPDLRGHGGSMVGNETGTAAQLADDLIGFLETVTGPAAVVGYSMGGSIALLAAAERSDLFRELIVIATSSVVGRAAAEFFAGRIAQLEAGDLDGFAAGLRDDTAQQVLTEVDLDALVAGRLAAIGDGAGYVNAARAMMAMRDAPLTPRLADIAGRVDVIVGDGDVFCPPKAGRMIVDALPDGAFHQIPGAGHLITVDRPDALVTLLDRLLNDQAP